MGMADVPVVHIVERLADRSIEELEGLAEQALDSVCAALLCDDAAPGSTSAQTAPADVTTT